MSRHSTNTEYHAALHLLVLDGPGPFVFDTIEIAASNMEAGERNALREAEVDCTWIAAVRALCSPRDKSGPKMMLFRRPLFQIIKTYDDKPRSSSDSSRMRWDEIHELFLYGPNPTRSAIQLERGAD